MMGACLKRSDGRRWGIRGVVGALGAALFLALPVGCELTGQLEEVGKLHYEEKDLSPSALAERMKQIDGYYAEPRNPTKVQLSYEVSMDSISAVNGYGALWRGARACSWIGLNDPKRSRRQEYAEKGIEMGRESAKKASTNVESFYYLALCEAALAQVMGSASRDLVRDMRDNMLCARALNEKYDFCGADRFLGELMVETADRPIWAIGTMEQGLAHLKKAADECPEFGQNHLKYGIALMKDDEPVKARRELEKVLACPRPPDYSTEHDAWLKEATELITELTPAG